MPSPGHQVTAKSGHMALSLSTLHPLFAAQVSGVDPSRPIDPSDWAAIQDALGKTVYGV